jgi:NAD+ diphosphatase
MVHAKPDFAFIHSPLNRRAEWRSKEVETTAHTIKNCVWIKGDAVRMAGEDLFLAMPADVSAEVIFLGEDPEQQLWFATQAGEGEDLQALRGLMQQQSLPPQHLSILAQARSLVHWHETHGFCAKCGAKSDMADRGYRRHCKACGGEHFPRTDPVVIMAVRHGEEFLLGRQSVWPPGMYSTLAGFVEPGETIEAAVAREVLEEAGIVVCDVTYVASQPWPFPASLMIGAVATAESRDITIDGNELEDARWFSRDELQLMLNHTHPDGLVASHPYAIAHHLIRWCLES